MRETDSLIPLRTGKNMHWYDLKFMLFLPTTDVIVLVTSDSLVCPHRAEYEIGTLRHLGFMKESDFKQHWLCL
jgi:hypothetical protein